MTGHKLALTVLPGLFAICRLRPDEPIPAWALAGDFTSITRTSDELSLVCPAERMPQGSQVEGGWRCLKIAGPLDFALAGVLASVTAPLAQAGVSIFAISTYDTDYVLVKDADSERAIETLAQAGHRITL